MIEAVYWLWLRHQRASGLEDRIAQLTELVATAISDAKARADLAASRARIAAAMAELPASDSWRFIRR